MDLIGLLLVFLLIVGAISYFIAAAVYRSAKKKQNPHAGTIRNVTFIISFLVITIGVLYILLENISLRR